MDAPDGSIPAPPGQGDDPLGDEYAGLAMQAIVIGQSHNWTEAQVAESAWRLSAAMLAERNRRRALARLRRDTAVVREPVEIPE